MEKGQPYFDPYNFNLQGMQGGMQPGMQSGMQGMSNMNQMPDMDMMTANPVMYYEQQYMYYKYLTQMLDYKMKMKEWEKMNREPTK
ncbi:MAG: hypothetical protein PHD15_04450 [Clostridia bacterium]|nr:hypothetical protein [Clostridia bacterium]MDD4386990.1 hypothetical protein [Clostridia bacterium]